MHIQTDVFFSVYLAWNQHVFQSVERAENRRVPWGNKQQIGTNLRFMTIEQE